MNEQKAYRALMLLAAVAALGFGGYWLMGRGSGADAVAVREIRGGSHGPRETVPLTPPQGVRRPNAEPTGTAPDRPRRGGHDSKAGTTAGRRPRPRGERAVNKVKILPGC